MDKQRVGLIYGGQSSEHEISILSARNVYRALDPDRYEVVPLHIDRAGRWHLDPTPEVLFSDDARPDAALVLVAPHHEGGGLAVLREGRVDPLSLDVAFPMLHGQNGEDGVIQGLLKAAGIPYVGADVLGSSVCMDKAVAKHLLEGAGLPVARYRIIHRADREAVSYHEVYEALGLPLFVKPANSGSSVGISKVTHGDEYEAALDEAFRFDKKLLVEEAITGREIECSVLGNEHPEASVPGEIVSTASFYTYDAKYTDPEASRMEVPADLPEPVTERVRALAVEAYRVLGCEGMARVDFFVRPDGSAVINEINTIPGFTSRSMYPVMWEHTGLDQPALMDRLIELALERHERDAGIVTSRA